MVLAWGDTHITGRAQRYVYPSLFFDFSSYSLLNEILSVILI